MYKNTRIKVIFSTILGNALEFYDLMLFGIFAPIISSLFFCSADKYLSLSLTYLSFAVGFVFRPLGSWYFGQIADKFGRKRALSNSILLMACATGMIGLLPIYSQIGIWAPILITILRCVQGFSAGGEYNTSAIFLLEYTNKAKNLIACLLTASGVVGSLMATFLFNVSLNNLMPSWFWRVPFLIGATVGFLGLYIRLNLLESPEFKKILRYKKTVDNPSLEVLKLNSKQLLAAFIIGAFNGIIYYFQFVYLTTHFNYFLGMSLNEANYFTTLGLLFYMVFLIINGFIADKIGTQKVMAMSCLGFALLILPIFYTLNTGNALHIIICEIILSYMNASFCGLKHVFLLELFPANRRCTGVSIGYSLGLCLFGGTTPFIINFLNNTTAGSFIGAYYIIVFSIFCFLVINKYEHLRCHDRINNSI